MRGKRKKTKKRSDYTSTTIATVDNDDYIQNNKSHDNDYSKTAVLPNRH